jgi:hypothetical protein
LADAELWLMRSARILRAVRGHLARPFALWSAATSRRFLKR